MSKLLVLHLEKPTDFPYGPAVEIGLSLSSRDFGSEHEIVVVGLPRCIDAAHEDALKAAEEAKPDQIVVLTFDPLHMEFVLYRYIGNQWGSDIVDNQGKSPTAEEFLSGGERLHIATTDFFKLNNYWQTELQGQLSHLSAGLHAKGDIENGVAFHLLEKYKGSPTKVGLIGVPAFHEEHHILKEDVLKETFFLLMKKLLSDS